MLGSVGRSQRGRGDGHEQQRQVDPALANHDRASCWAHKHNHINVDLPLSASTALQGAFMMVFLNGAGQLIRSRNQKSGSRQPRSQTSRCRKGRASRARQSDGGLVGLV